MLKGIVTLTLAFVIGVYGFAQETAGVVRQILVQGNETIQTAFIKAAMRTAEGKPFNQSDLLLDEQSIRDLGYFKDVKVYSRPTTGPDWDVIVQVAENPVIKEIRITGNTVITTSELRKLIEQPIGQVLNLRLIQPSLKAIADLYIQKGYQGAQADVVPLPESPSTLNIVVYEYAVRDIIITGLTRTKKGVISRLLKTKPGQAFSIEKWSNDMRRLDSTQWFETIQPSTQPTGEIGKFDLLVDVKEARTAQIGFGVAIDPRSRLAGSLRYSDSNFRGLGQSVGVGLQQDALGTGLSASVSYSNPFMDSKETALNMQLYSRVQSYFTGIGFGGSATPSDDERFDERRTGFSFLFTRPFREIFSASAGLTAEDIRTIRLRKTGDVDYIQQDGTLVTLNTQVARDRRDVALDPSNGDFVRLIVEPAYSNITRIGGNVGANTEVLGEHTFLRTILEYKTFFSKIPRDPNRMSDPRRVIAFRARVGHLTGTVPFFEQLFVGGADSVRGYSDQRFWGKTSALASGEYRYPIQKSFNLIGFVDYGGAWGGYGTLNDFDQSSDLNMHLGYGVGVAFKTPLGPIRIDFGFNEDGGSRTHFSIGGSF